MEKMNVKQQPIADGHAGITGDRIAMKGVKRLAVMVQVGAGTAVTAFQVDLQQHDAAAAGNSKALAFDNIYFHKVGAATEFTKVEPTVDASAYDLHSVFGDSAGVVVLEVLAEDLDVDNDFDHVSVDISGAGTGTRQIGVVAIADDNYKPSYGNAL